MIDARGPKAEQQLALLDRAGDHADAGQLLGWLEQARGLGRARRHRAEGPFNRLPGSPDLDVADHDEADVRAHVVPAEEVEEVAAGQSSHALRAPDDGPAVGVGVEGGLEQPLGRHPIRIVAPLLDLLEHDLPLALELFGIEGRVLQGIGQDVEARLEEAAGEHEVIGGLVVAGPGVDLAPGPLDLLGDVADAPALRSLEHHVLAQVRDAGQILGLVGRADLHPGLEGHDRGGMVFLEDDLEPVGEAKVHERPGLVAAAVICLERSGRDGR